MKTSSDSRTSTNLPKVVYIGVSFMVLFSAYLITESLISHIYKNLGFTYLGPICILIVYTASTIGSVLVSHFEGKFTIKFGLVAGALAYVFFIFCGTLTVYCNSYGSYHDILCHKISIYSLNIIFACIIGSGASIIWISQAKYVNDCTNQTNQGIYHGIFWSIMQCSLLVGGIMAAFILRYTDEFVFYSILSCVAALSILLFLFLPPVAPKEVQASKKHDSTISDSIGKFIHLFQTPAYGPIISSSFLSGITVSSNITYFPLIIKSTIANLDANIINQRIAFVLMVYGIGQVMSGFSVGKLLDKFSKVKIGYCVFVSILFVSLLSFTAKITESYMVGFIAGFLWGINDNSLKTFNNTLISSKFNGKLELFALNRVAQSVAVVFGCVCTIFLAEIFGKFYMLLILCLQLGCQIIFYSTSKNMEPKDLSIELLER